MYSTCSPLMKVESPDADNHLAQHLANNHFDVLIVDLHTLQRYTSWISLTMYLASSRNTLQRRISCGLGGLRTIFTLLTCSPSNTDS